MIKLFRPKKLKDFVLRHAELFFEIEAILIKSINQKLSIKMRKFLSNMNDTCYFSMSNGKFVIVALLLPIKILNFLKLNKNLYS